jgi:negative regulator of replication initiation
MHRTQIYLQNDLYERLKTRARNVGVSVSELIRRSLEKDIQQDPVADAKAFFKRLKPLESFANTEPETYVRKLRKTSRLLRAKTDEA